MRVVIGVITNLSGEVLITQRAAHVPHPYLWEFPGGKCHAQETAEQALARELHEELGIQVTEYHFWGEFQHVYPDKSVCLLVYHVSGYQGTPVRQEAQLDLRWIAFDTLHQYEFPEANRRMIESMMASHFMVQI